MASRNDMSRDPPAGSRLASKQAVSSAPDAAASQPGAAAGQSQAAGVLGAAATGAQAPASPTPPHRKAIETQSPDGYVVARGRSVRHEGKSYGPGETIPDLSAEEAQWLLQAKFLVSRVDASATGKGVAVGGLRIMGGRRPGGVAT